MRSALRHMGLLWQHAHIFQLSALCKELEDSSLCVCLCVCLRRREMYVVIDFTHLLRGKTSRKIIQEKRCVCVCFVLRCNYG